MYASIKNIRGKSDEELRRLRSLGINELNIGVESGLDEALSRMNKGYKAEEALTELARLNAAGMDYGANIIFGCAGEGHSRENAEATARLLNETKPYLIFTGTIHADPGCPLYDDMQSGTFRESTFGEYLEEEERFLSLRRKCWISYKEDGNSFRTGFRTGQSEVGKAQFSTHRNLW